MKKFKEFTSLLETPLLNDYLSKDKMELLANHTKQRITSSTSPESKIDNFYPSFARKPQVLYGPTAFRPEDELQAINNSSQ